MYKFVYIIAIGSEYIIVFPERVCLSIGAGDIVSWAKCIRIQRLRQIKKDRQIMKAVTYKLEVLQKCV